SVRHGDVQGQGRGSIERPRAPLSAESHHLERDHHAVPQSHYLHLGRDSMRGNIDDAEHFGHV
ncbi:MAG TPA: hypothetical protein VNO21_00350, partial [Polyangiaceae bacterium]|nr:hypothetical protein [Polyangiaceae bacterium]